MQWRGWQGVALAILGVKELSRGELQSIVDEVVRDSHDLISFRGAAAEKALMGHVMERVRGRADGKIVSEVVHTSLEAYLQSRGEKPKKKKK